MCSCRNRPCLTVTLALRLTLTLRLPRTPTPTSSPCPCPCAYPYPYPEPYPYPYPYPYPQPSPGILIAFDVSIAAFMSLQIRDFMIGAVHSYQLMKVVLGFTACAWGVATDAEPDLGVLRSFWMKSLFALAAAALGIP